MSVGRSPNGKKIGADKAGVAVTDRGFIPVDNQMRTNVPHIFAIGDIVGQPMLAHKATHEGQVAAEAAAGEKSYFDARVIPSVAYTDPEIAWVGLTEDEAKAKGIKVEKALFPWAASGRAIANGRDEGLTKLLFDATTHRIVGGGIVGTHAGDLIAEIALAIEMGADAVDIGRTDPSASDAVRIGRPRRRGVRGRVHGSAAGAQEITLLHRRNDARPRAGRRVFAARKMTATEERRHDPGRAEAGGRPRGDQVRRRTTRSSASGRARPRTSSSTSSRGSSTGSRARSRARSKTAERLKAHGIYVEELNNVADVPVYVDGADEVTEHGAMIKGGGGALTREKIVAAVARKFVCIVDASKLVPVLGKFPLPVEVIPMARSYVARQLVLLGGQPAWRMGFTTDNGNVILDVHGLAIVDPVEMEARIRGDRRRGHRRAVRAARRRRDPARHDAGVRDDRTRSLSPRQPRLPGPRARSRRPR